MAKVSGGLEVFPVLDNTGQGRWWRPFSVRMCSEYNDANLEIWSRSFLVIGWSHNSVICHASTKDKGEKISYESYWRSTVVEIVREGVENTWWSCRNLLILSLIWAKEKFRLSSVFELRDSDHRRRPARWGRDGVTRCKGSSEGKSYSFMWSSRYPNHKWIIFFQVTWLELTPCQRAPGLFAIPPVRFPYEFLDALFPWLEGTGPSLRSPGEKRNKTEWTTVTRELLIHLTSEKAERSKWHQKQLWC